MLSQSTPHSQSQLKKRAYWLRVHSLSMRAVVAWGEPGSSGEAGACW